MLRDLATNARHRPRVASRAASILDAGCATGTCSLPSATGITAVAGLDPSPRCAACHDRGFEAYVGSISLSRAPA
jgi:2-polyprenyl-3-methyl-5-hydroxy-6-metoxy-1,4-benzoquinol methylase